MKKWFAFASVLVLTIVIAACGANNGNSVETSGAAAEELGTPTSEIVITAKNYEFDQKEYKIKAGETVGLKLASVDGVHGVSILKTDYDIKKDETVPVKFDKPGTYNIICNVPCGGGHALMKAKLVVE
ncbi:cytochrome C oxidase subunit II [Paenibacillus soyae]|uniref:Cytochrome C oxidase subunit II n=1 Tax=Paenibacillus soyae TaxID=2969249 RepID=A0A9X2S6Y0_9BACL|nr:cytochrome C oxidase subunit II [Paenibacillus soyae]MCR2802460.1 cytochrome C oxidase subunit II [Paenibacillus soyae]